ncbi:DNA-3-methyladenine glycosylase I [Marinomonas mediterranea]|jgi:DNA-3-methyladenine glycosylase I (EC 3.2.2.20)|uniref:DNA-3-methyladenine glycosylase I n=1 Tax=Marinomonas mediterranea (strain ATCC 700492 / JCM 21426 / NBRC 103028 / MMB-1) TaxID=717774 RepID=F2JXN9_MARM1|nr:DNA-3-methyladenine glycosylase I [Marinomonas mediterranea]ADZ93037.1 DNA-3-methyladenine glycosylase I [Marinomonas mediterranea MMB-1]WCN10946.1 DNA-3-methyladenine glycosylase I [Marinomonas mediterranea]WCN15008.1 DNA-3-methyladenine glycosylase I [Marinomonas mediterranea]WCN19052.1 DNA-3-methyladenine glycosylase I [Marinomonas mediterranea MMB-1]
MGTFTGEDNKQRCSWCSATEQYTQYHDKEWGFPVDDDRRLFEKLCLESFQSGLSWRTILEKRDNFRNAFDNFEIEKMANYTEKDVERLVQDAGIIRHKGKITAVINNAQRAKELIKKEGSLATYFWRFEPEAKAEYETVSTSPESTEISKQLKKMGWKFVGPTTIYSFMQAMGLVNDHHPDCYLKAEIDAIKAQYKRPA